MVVVRKGQSGFARGIIDGTTLRPSLNVERVESRSQAVRHLIELGVVELLGQQAGVPYWTCLGGAAAEPQVLYRQEVAFHRSPPAARAAPVQAVVQGTTGRNLGQIQAREGLMASGQVDFATRQRLAPQAAGLSGDASVRTPSAAADPPPVGQAGLPVPRVSGAARTCRPGTWDVDCADQLRSIWDVLEN